MQDIPLSMQLIALAVLLVLSGCFSLTETAMMAVNRYKLKARVEAGERGAKLTADLLAQTDKLLGVILLFNNLVNAAAATLTGVIAIQLFGEEEWALGVGTLVITFLILVFSEITPKVIGARYADRLSVLAAYMLTPLLRVFYPVVWFVNLFVAGLLALGRISLKGGQQAQHLSNEELRLLVLEAGQFVPQKHRAILVNLFELENVTVEDVMTPRGSIEALDVADPIERLREQIATSYHTRLPVYEDDPSNVIGILHQRRVLAAMLGEDFDHDAVREGLSAPYYVPASTPIYNQLQYFQENKQRIALVVDEYGEIQGLVTLEDLIEEIVGKFTTSVPTASDRLAWGQDDTALVEGTRSLRELNRRLDLQFPLDGPKTINGLILEHLQDIPESGLSLVIAGVRMEIVHLEDRRVKTVRLMRPASDRPESG